MKKSRFNKINLKWFNTHVAFYLILICFSSYGQVGINTTDPKGTLDITSVNNTGLVVPRVTAIEDVTDGNGNPPENGTQVYDMSRNSMCFYQDSSWICMGLDTNGDPVLTNETATPNLSYDDNIDYIKASNTGAFDHFGYATAVSGDGNTLAVTAYTEASNATGINGDQTDNSQGGSGAIYLFTRTGNVWSQQAYIKAPTLGVSRFGKDIALANNGDTLAVATESSTAYVFYRTGNVWNAIPDSINIPCESIAISNDGNTLAISNPSDDSNATGINGNQANTGAVNSGAVYIFAKMASVWNQQAYIKASNTGIADFFGKAIALSSDGNTLAVGAPNESSSATGINGIQIDNSSGSSGATYVFTRSGTIWAQQSYIKASNTNPNDYFGQTLDLSNDGNTLAIGAYGEDSNATGVNGNQSDNSAIDSGAVYTFKRMGSTWNQQAYIKASNTDSEDTFGRTAVVLSGDGNTIAVGSVGFLNAFPDTGEDSNATGVDGDQTNNSALYSGATYVFNWDGAAWAQEAYVKATNTDAYDFFGFSISLSTNGSTLAIGAIQEDSDATGINGNQSDFIDLDYGAVYVYTTN